MCMEALRVKGINYLIDVNSKLHHTSEFVTPDLVVRRGQPFTIRLDLNRELFPQDKVVLQLSLKLQAQKLQDMTLHLTMGPGADPRDWGATVVHKVQHQVNSNDDKGILVGSWSGTYPCGTHPGEWTGSSAILQNFRQTSMPVRYGQCWVFSGVLTTVMRAIGIPCRSITNFTSAHDTGGNVTVDVYINENGERLSDVTKDSIWNFHVWNDVWMKRPDLPQGYDGWQALDSTPQEKSQGIFQCGPAPLYAIKSGEIKVPHDTKFVFAEVNADVVTWKVEKSGSGPEKISKLKVQPSMVGRNISTKAPGKDTREDITLQYKFPEGEEGS
ncbi:hypothetical protein Z043_108593 [Scleropages formosus]|uniref:Transglutaminase-like domain-containing protein n=1 Tax=Scleropages formosus TaxID=113540 RepID=A0A0P7USI1_SCLFO|nr:hypothetical protein Z043_108593 [Scleropages formosus]